MYFFFSSRRRHTRWPRDWSSDVCSSDLRESVRRGGAMSCIEVWQLTDSHLGSEAGTRLLGMDTDRSLQAVIRQARQERGRADLLLATGDLADQGSTDPYRRFAGYTRGLAEHTTWLPGNPARKR